MKWSLLPPTHDQIALLCKRETKDTFKYKIELLRKWKGLPLDQGTVQIQKIDSDSTYFFKGGNSNCDILVKIYRAGKWRIVCKHRTKMQGGVYEYYKKRVSRNVE
jgi:hypothetical protein